MATIVAVGGPIDGQVVDTDSPAFNVVSHGAFGRVTRIAYRCDFESGAAYVVDEEVL